MNERMSGFFNLHHTTPRARTNERWDAGTNRREAVAADAVGLSLGSRARNARRKSARYVGNVDDE